MAHESKVTSPLYNFIDPQELLGYAVYLLFSNNRELEGEFYESITRACKSANLLPKEISVRNNKIFLSYYHYVPFVNYIFISSDDNSKFNLSFIKANEDVFAGQLPAPYKELGLEKRVFTF